MHIEDYGIVIKLFKSSNAGWVKVTSFDYENWTIDNIVQALSDDYRMITYSAYKHGKYRENLPVMDDIRNIWEKAIASNYFRQDTTKRLGFHRKHYSSIFEKMQKGS